MHIKQGHRESTWSCVTDFKNQHNLSSSGTELNLTNSTLYSHSIHLLKQNPSSQAGETAQWFHNLESFQKTKIQPPATLWRLTTTCSYSSMGSDAHLWPPQALILRHHKQTYHSKNIYINKKKKKLLRQPSPTKITRISRPQKRHYLLIFNFSFMFPTSLIGYRVGNCKLHFLGASKIKSMHVTKFWPVRQNVCHILYF